MRLTVLLALVGLAIGQFDLFSQSEPAYASIVDQFGVKDAFGAWGKVLRNLATKSRQNLNREVDAREFTVQPKVGMDREQLKAALMQPKANGEIINERLLNILLPRINGESPFITTTTTAKPTTKKATQKTTPKTTKTTQEAIMATEKTTAETKTTKTATTTTEATTTEKATTTKAPTTITTTEEPTTAEMTNPSNKRTTKDDPQFTVLFHTASKDLLDDKEKVESEVLNIIKEKVAQHEEKMKSSEEQKKEEKKEEKKEGKNVSKKDKSVEMKKVKSGEDKSVEMKKTPATDSSEAVSMKPIKKDKNQESAVTTEFSSDKPKDKDEWDDDESDQTTNNSTVEPITIPKHISEEINMRNMLKEKYVDSQEVAMKPIHTVESSEETTPAASISVEAATKETTTKKTTTTQTATTQEATTTKASTTTQEATATQEATSIHEEVATETETAETNDVDEEVEENVEKEANEILNLLKKVDSQDGKDDSASRKLLIDRLSAFLEAEREKNKKESAETVVESTTPTAEPTSESTTTPTSESTTQEENHESGDKEAATEETNKEEGAIIQVASLSTTQEATAAADEPTTTETVPTTTDYEAVATRKIQKAIPEAEEELAEEDVPLHQIPSTSAPSTNAATENLQMEVTSPPTASSSNAPAPTGSVFNLQANANSDASPQLTNVITPIAGIIDGISPILMPLFGGSSRSRAAGSRTYEPNGRDIMEEGTAEDSLVGFGSQLAREILNPGIHKRERQARDRIMAAKVAEAKMLRATNEQILPNTAVGVPQDARTLPSRFAPRSFSQAQEEVRSPIRQGSSFIVAHPASVPTVPVAAAIPPPGYSGPLPPPPPPPPAGYIPDGYNGPVPTNFDGTALPTQRALGPITVDGASSPSANNAYFPPNLSNRIDEPKKVTKPKALPPRKKFSGKDDGYEEGRDTVKYSFMEDSGVMNGPAPDVNPRQWSGMSGTGLSLTPVSAPSQTGAPKSPGGGGGSFGSGRGPAESFDLVAKKSKDDLSFFSSQRRKFMKKL